AASKAHALAIAEAGILTLDECGLILRALDGIGEKYAHNRDAVRDDAQAEDIHHFVELRLTEAIGDLGLKVHTGRSRNEQIATDLRLYIRSRIDILSAHLGGWAGALVEQAKKAGDAVMPSYPHLP